MSDLEKRYAREREKVRNRDVASANTLHDLQQPLAALRMKLRALLNKSENRPIAAEDMEASLAYIGQLMDDASKQRENEVTFERLPPDSQHEAQSAFTLRKVTDSVM